MWSEIAQHGIALDNNLWMYLQPLLLNRSERCCGPLDIAFELEQPGRQRLGNPEAAGGECLDRCPSYSSPGKPGAVMEPPKLCIVASGLLDRPFECGSQVFHTGGAHRQRWARGGCGNPCPLRQACTRSFHTFTSCSLAQPNTGTCVTGRSATLGTRRA